jgi:hypothetical protein
MNSSDKVSSVLGFFDSELIQTDYHDRITLTADSENTCTGINFDAVLQLHA